MEHLPEDILLNLKQILAGEHFLNLLHIFLAVLHILQRTQYLEVQFPIYPLRLVVFLYLLFVVLKLLENL